MACEVFTTFYLHIAHLFETNHPKREVFPFWEDFKVHQKSAATSPGVLPEFGGKSDARGAWGNDGL